MNIRLHVEITKVKPSDGYWLIHYRVTGGMTFKGSCYRNNSSVESTNDLIDRVRRDVMSEAGTRVKDSKFKQLEGFKFTVDVKV